MFNLYRGILDFAVYIYKHAFRFFFEKLKGHLEIIQYSSRCYRSAMFQKKIKAHNEIEKRRRKPTELRSKTFNILVIDL